VTFTVNAPFKALFSNHVYEEVGHEIYELQNTHQNVGLGNGGRIETPMEEHDFLALVKKKNAQIEAAHETHKDTDNFLLMVVAMVHKQSEI
jgi:hypothetical protein